jgi:hypothetical protein
MYPLLSAHHKTFNVMWRFLAGHLFTSRRILALTNSTVEMKGGVLRNLKLEKQVYSRLTTRDIRYGLNVTPHHQNSPLD